MMKMFESVKDWRSSRPKEGSIGFVPTMGALHKGHLSLVKRSLEENDFTLVSIFINPTQFNDAKDFEKYPKTLESDLGLLRAAGADAVFLPRAQEIYSDEYRYKVTETQLSKELCGAHRPGHFDGVLTVVNKLFHIVDPHRAYFGEKDYQQLELIRGMVKALWMDIEIIGCPTTRELSGLAMSSRNRLLPQEVRVKAPELYRAISSLASTVDAREELEREGFEVEYLEDRDGRRFVAAKLGGVRLIDNVTLNGPDNQSGAV